MAKLALNLALNFVRGERYKIVNQPKWKDRILYYVGKSVFEEGMEYFESDLEVFNLEVFNIKKSFDTILLKTDDYDFIIVSDEEEEQKLNHKCKTEYVRDNQPN